MTIWFIPSPSEEDLDGLLVLEPRADFDPYIIGVVRRFNDTFVLYDQQGIIEMLAAQMDPQYGDELTQAVEYFEFNTIGAWVGEDTPGFLVRGDNG
jgi:hypothetical protein